MNEYSDKYIESSDLENCVFDDFFDVDEIQKLQDNVSRALRIACIITYPDGKPITKPSNFCNFCEKVVRTSKVGLANCMLSDATLGKPHKGGPLINRCPAGLMDAGVSIMVGDKHVANWLCGQVRDETINFSEEENRKKALEMELDPDIYCKAISEVTFMSHENVVNTANLIYIIANQLSEIAYKNYLQGVEIENRKKLEKKLIEEHEKLVKLHTRDILTGVYSRSYFNSKVAEYDEHTEIPVTVIMGDVNNLKFVNDIFGHHYGDELIVTACNILKEYAKDNYIIGRCGGDEFNIIIPNGTIEEAKEYCEKVQAACCMHTLCDITPSIALGCAARNLDTQKLSAVIGFAETKMYHNKALMKQKQNILGDIENLLYKKGYLDKEYISMITGMAVDFAKYMNFDTDTTNNLAMLARIVNFGLVSLSQEHFNCIDNVEMVCEQLEAGYRIAKLSEKTSSLADCVYQSQEWWCGHGVPMHKKEHEIKPLARIINIINYFVRMISSCPYGYSRTYKVAVNLIKKYSSKRFDPVYAEKFIAFTETELSYLAKLK